MSGPAPDPVAARLAEDKAAAEKLLIVEAVACALNLDVTVHGPRW